MSMPEVPYKAGTMYKAMAWIPDKPYRIIRTCIRYARPGYSRDVRTSKKLDGHCTTVNGSFGFHLLGPNPGDSYQPPHETGTTKRSVV